ncbi:DUF58 domain-containing protein [Kangiella aquimarina]|uniref:DUF58 domain-containing protein n=1 Tax=Kangiella aquimarina TaxID=261965 RepID=A0ABZ0X6P9_9GAMM|nr:DUF58 domain-containing protein [Kangiella aquimarina]WQG86248.1 DUF58 domain-containing protein [Kangiella aquimarina]
MKIVSAIEQKFFSWVDKRSPEQQEVHLRQKNIYILPTRYGWLMLMILILILVASTNYQNNMGFMAGFILLAIGMLSVFYTYRNVRGLKIRALKPQSVYVGQECSFPFEFNNSSESYRSSIGIGLNKKQVEYCDVDSRSKTLFHIKIKANKRGLLEPKRFVCTSIFPFGIFQVWSWFKPSYGALIYPKPIECPQILAPQSHGQEEGAFAQRGSEDFHSLRDYQSGDPIKQVMWKAFARERGLLTKEFEELVGEQHLLTWESVSQYDKELAISYLTDAVIKAEQAGNLYGLELPKVRIEKGQGAEHLHQCLSALALME